MALKAQCHRFSWKKDGLKIGSSLFAITLATGLPVDHPRSYHRCFAVADKGSMKITKALNNEKFDWYLLLPRVLTDEIEAMAWPFLFGQGILVQDITGRTTLMPIAEAVTVCLGNSAGLLECIISMVHKSLQFQKKGYGKRYTIKYKDTQKKRPGIAKALIVSSIEEGWAFGLHRGSSVGQIIKQHVVQVLL